MTYTETIDYLYSAAPLFQNVGGAAYKEGLTTTHLLDEHFGHPHRKIRTIHIAGTNGKGSCAHTLAAMLMHHGFRVGLYTSPHLIEFRERIRVDGKMIPKQDVTDFVAKERNFFEPLHPSFFELTTLLAFKYFAESKVDVAVIEVGLGGRLDSTNIITPELSVITNISLEHTQFLGNSLQAIAGEKAGIIKPSVPVIIGETLPETRPIFEQKALAVDAPILFAEEVGEVISAQLTPQGLFHYETRSFGPLEGELVGDCQVRNTSTILAVAHLLRKNFGIETEDVKYALRNVCQATGLMGRWQKLGEHPTIVCDTGHNAGGWDYISPRLQTLCATYPKVHVVFGMAADKDVSKVLSRLPRSATYYWTQASVRRALSASELKLRGNSFSLEGEIFPTVAEAYAAAMTSASKADFIYVGGSSFIVADLLKHLNA